jgi:hypothetical protein
MTYTTIMTTDGKIYTGCTRDAAVTRMREAGIFTFGKTNAEYMQFVADRAVRFNGVVIRTDTADMFLQDMATHQLITLGDF